MRSQRQIAENVLTAYLGAQTGPRVLAGQIRRGSGVEMRAAIWSSDLRGFTAFSDAAPSARVIAVLNELFEMQSRAISAHGGEILKFVGDGSARNLPRRDRRGCAPRRGKRARRGARNAGQTGRPAGAPEGEAACGWSSRCISAR